MNVERVLRFVFRPRVRVTRLATVTMDEKRGVLEASQPELNALSLTVSYGYIAGPNGKQEVGRSQHELTGPCVVEARVEEPWGLHRWWLARQKRRAEASARLELTMATHASRAKVATVPAGTAFKDATGRDFYLGRSVSMSSWAAVDVHAHSGFGLWWRKTFVWPLRRAFDRRK